MKPIAAPSVRVLFADAGLVVVDKPAGMPSVPARSAADPPDVARVLAPVIAPGGDLEAAHRLDRDTSGLLVLARGSSYQEIADDLGISVKTVGHHVSAVLRKTGSSSRRDLRSPVVVLNSIATRIADERGLMIEAGATTLISVDISYSKLWLKDRRDQSIDKVYGTKQDPV